MALKFSVTVRNARLDTIETAIGVSPTMKIRSGAAPGGTALADAGTVLATVALPADWLQNAAAGSKSMSGTWEDISADAAGTAGHFRVYASGGTCHMEGTITVTGGGGDMTLDNTVFAVGQDFTVTSFTINEANA